jgi:hypothetical protein
VHVAQLPEVGHQPLQLGCGEVQAVLPEISVLQARVLLDLQVVGQRRVDAREAAGQAEGGVDQRVVAGGDRREVDRISEQIGGATGPAIEAQEGVAKHRGRVVEVRSGEDQGRAFGPDRLAPPLEASTRLGRQAHGIDLQALHQPLVTGPKAALGVLKGLRLFEGR